MYTQEKGKRIKGNKYQYTHFNKNSMEDLHFPCMTIKIIFNDYHEVLILVLKLHA